MDLKTLFSAEKTARIIETERKKDELKKHRKKSKTKSSRPISSQDFTHLKTFYVYLLIDPRNDEIFYVGKGTEGRVFQHNKDAQNKPAETLKLQKIKEIADHGLIEKRLIVGRFDTAKEALAVEATLIHWVYGKENLTNDQSGHGVDYIRPKDNHHFLPGIDEPELAYSEREKEKRHRYNVIDFLKVIEKVIKERYGITFEPIDQSREKHTYLYKLMCDVKLSIVTHHNARESATVTIECVQNNQFYKDQIYKIARNTRFNARKKGAYARIDIPAKMWTDIDVIVEKFMESHNELEAYQKRCGELAF